MILVDSSIWIDHLRKADTALAELLETTQVLTHPFVIGELALGNLARRETILRSLGKLPKSIVARDDEVVGVIDRHKFIGTGIGYVDAHLLSSVILTPGAKIWTRDKPCLRAAIKLGLSYRV